MHRKFRRGLGAALLASAALLLAPAAASAAGASGPPRLVCSGGPIVAGRYTSITVTGVCFMPGGVVTVLGPLRVAPGAALLANFPATGSGPEGDATVIVDGGVRVGKDATLMLGCSPHLGCTHTTSDRVDGGLRAWDALGVILHSDSFRGDVSLRGGGGGVSCVPSGVFASIGAPPYSDLEDNTVRGHLSVSGLDSCWFGMLRNMVHGSVSVRDNTMADPDSMEVLQNTIWGHLSCEGNLPAVQFGDSGASPNQVRGKATGQCASPISERFA